MTYMISKVMPAEYSSSLWTQFKNDGTACCLPERRNFFWDVEDAHREHRVVKDVASHVIRLLKPLGKSRFHLIPFLIGSIQHMLSNTLTNDNR
ncbi:hypothetical protein TNCV_3277081 [Trichonephila clavipes]|nr:hypothetical protein TNCV_3277081 [Trichonephila clavipes]